MNNSNFQLDVGYCYVTETLGQKTPIYKVGKTQGSVRNRIRPGSTYAPQGICVHRVQIFYDYPSAEKRIHKALAEWHCSPELAGQATEMFSADLDTIFSVIDDHVALQKDFAKEKAKQFEELKVAGFLQENPATLIDDILQAIVYGKVSLQSAIIRSINSSSHEEKIRTALLDFGVEVNRKTKVARVACRDMLVALCPDAKARSAVEALANLSHFNSQGHPIFAT